MLGPSDLASTWPLHSGRHPTNSLWSPLRGWYPDRWKGNPALPDMAHVVPRTGEDFKTGPSFAEHSPGLTPPRSALRLHNSPLLSTKNRALGPRIQQCPGGSSHDTPTRLETPRLGRGQQVSTSSTNGACGVQETSRSSCHCKGFKDPAQKTNMGKPFSSF